MFFFLFLAWGGGGKGCIMLLKTRGSLKEYCGYVIRLQYELGARNSGATKLLLGGLATQLECFFFLGGGGMLYVASLYSGILKKSIGAPPNLYRFILENMCFEQLPRVQPHSGCRAQGPKGRRTPRAQCGQSEAYVVALTCDCCNRHSIAWVSGGIQAWQKIKKDCL